jgi:hypothetical protein
MSGNVEERKSSAPEQMTACSYHNGGNLDNNKVMFIPETEKAHPRLSKLINSKER